MVDPTRTVLLRQIRITLFYNDISGFNIFSGAPPPDMPYCKKGTYKIRI